MKSEFVHSLVKSEFVLQYSHVSFVYFTVLDQSEFVHCNFFYASALLIFINI